MEYVDRLIKHGEIVGPTPIEQAILPEIQNKLKELESLKVQIQSKEVEINTMKNRLSELKGGTDTLIDFLVAEKLKNKRESKGE